MINDALVAMFILYDTNVSSPDYLIPRRSIMPAEPKNFPSEARVVVVGGGIMGCSTAYHLAKAGVKDVVLVERKQLTCGTTWHSAAQVRQLRSSANLTQLIRNSVELYKSLEAETGQATGWIQKGSLSLAANPERFTHIKRQAALARLFDVEAAVISADEAGRHWPLIRIDDVLGAVYSPDDGRVNPSDVCAALIKGAKAHGAHIFEDTAITGFENSNGRISSVITEHGRITTEAVALCAGLWSRDVAKLAGVSAPLYACEHFYLLTETMDGIDGHLPTLSDHGGHLYIRDETGGLLVGCFEPNAKPLPMDKLPKDFAFDLMTEDWDHFEPMLENAMHRIPALETAQARMLLNGPESFTPDGQFLLGESPELPSFFLGCGMNSVGVASGGGAGRALAEWIIEGRSTMDLWEVDVGRFAPFQSNLRMLHERIPEELGLHYAISYPGRHPESARCVRRTPVHERLAQKGGHFGVRAGWERAEFFMPEGETIADDLTFGRPPWFENTAAEHLAARKGVVCVDQSSFAKFIVEGPNATSLLQRLCANDVDVAPGRIIYTAMLNDQGGIESDVTIFKITDDKYFLVTGTGQAVKDTEWINRHKGDDRATLTDVTSGYAVLGVAGPQSEEILARISGDDVSLTNFPRYRHREIEAGYGIVRAARLSYTGEAGFELYIPSEFAIGVYDALSDAGRDLGLMDIGTTALTSLRVERGFRAWGHDISAADTPFEAGLGHAVKLEKNAGFIGHDALARQRDAGPARHLAFLTCTDPGAYPIGGEPIIFNGQPVGQITSAAYGHSVGAAVCMGYVEHPPAKINEMAAAGGFAIDIACELAPATFSFDPPYPGRAT